MNHKKELLRSLWVGYGYLDPVGFWHLGLGVSAFRNIP